MEEGAGPDGLPETSGGNVYHDLCSGEFLWGMLVDVDSARGRINFAETFELFHRGSPFARRRSSRKGRVSPTTRTRPC
jgi:hypothetical protein